MLKLIIRWIKGYLFVELCGNSPERFINLCRHHKIYIRKVSQNSGKHTFYMYAGDYFKIHDIAFKTSTYPHILYRKGIPFLIRAVLSAKSLAPCFILFMAIICILSKIVWNIDISGELRHTDEEISRYLSEINVYEGMRVDKVDGDEIERLIRNRYNDISWVSVELRGTNIYIKLLEANIMQNRRNNSGDYSNITASSNGVVKSIITRAGTPMVRPGDKVKKGDILVSGIINIYDDSGEIVKRNPVYADADVYIDTHYKYKDEFDMIYMYRQYTGKKKKSMFLNISGNQFFLENPLNKFDSYENYDIIKQCTDVEIAGIKLGDVSVSYRTINEYEPVFATYNNEEAVNKARNNLRVYLNRLIGEGIIINSKDIQVNIKDGVCRSLGKVFVTEPQIQRTAVSEQDWRVNTANEQNGEDN